MKSSRGGAPQRRMTLAEAEAMTRRDKRRIIILAVGAVLLIGAYLTTELTKPAEEFGGKNLPGMAEATQETQVFTPEFDATQVLDTIRDAPGEQRLVLSGEALDALLKYAVILQTPNYEQLGLRHLDSAVAAELLAAPAEHRADALRVRGRVVRMTAMASADAAVKQRQLVAVELVDGGWAHLAFLRPPDGIELGDVVRMDGLFAQIYHGMADGELREGPLLVGSDLVASEGELVAKDHETLAIELRQSVRDDTISEKLDEPTGAMWDLMAFAQQRADEIDWDEAMELDNETLAKISNDGTFFRGQPFTLPISGNLGIWTERADENGLRLERVTRGWIGNFTWRDPSPVIQFIAPFDRGELQDRQVNRLVTAKAFFLRNVAYERRDGKSAAMAPMFVLADVETFVPVPNNTPRYILLGVLGGTILMIVLISFLLRADARSSRKLQEELVRRRRERRERTSSEPSPQSS